MNPFLSMEVQQSLVLASASPRRKEILERLGFEFEVIPPQVDENEIFHSDPEREVSLLAELKGVDAQLTRPRKTIIAADTLVVCEGKKLGKPGSPQEAADTLALLSGRRHEVVSGLIVIAPPNRRVLRVEKTGVYVRELEKAEISRYIDTGEPFDKAGAYAIQGQAAVFVEKVEGCYLNVVGLPVFALFKILREMEAS